MPMVILQGWSSRPQGEKGEPGDKGEPGEKGDRAKGYRGLTGTTGAKEREVMLCSEHRLHKQSMLFSLHLRQKITQELM